jgi:UDP-N-acetyl-D-glucosamine dehydrogenase
MSRSPVKPANFSIAPDGMRYPLPAPADLTRQLASLKPQLEGRSVVVVQGLGFVGSAVAAAIAGATGPEGHPRWLVIGVDLPSPQTWWKINRINEGKAPIQSPDPEFNRLVHQAVTDRKNLFATASESAYEWAEIIVVDVPLDVLDTSAKSPGKIQINWKAFESALRTVGQHMRPDALVIVETTAPVGTCEKVVAPLLKRERLKRGIQEPLALAYAYERVMPGPRYLDSIRKFWRVLSGIDERSTQRARQFLASFTDTQTFEPAELPDMASAELGKSLENSYRAVNIAFIHEWTLFAEQAGINLWAVVDAIRVRKGTHDNMRYPGFGVGGYCLTKDSLLAQWSARHHYKSDLSLGMTLNAMQTNHQMPLHTLKLLRELAGRSFRGLPVLIAGVSYLPDLADARHSPAEIFVDKAKASGARVSAHDPCLHTWPERASIPLYTEWSKAVASAQAVVLAVPHTPYRQLGPHDFPRPILIVDANNVLSDATAHALHRTGCRLLGVGKGHWRRAGLHLKK